MKNLLVKLVSILWLGLAVTAFGQTPNASQPPAIGTTKTVTVVPSFVWIEGRGFQYVVNVPLVPFDTKIKNINFVEFGGFTGDAAKGNGGVGGLDVTKTWNWAISPTITFIPSVGVAWEAQSGYRPYLGAYASFGVSLKF